MVKLEIVYQVVGSHDKIVTKRRVFKTQAALERFRSVRQVQLLTDDTEKTKGFYRSLGLLTLPELGCCGFMRP